MAKPNPERELERLRKSLVGGAPPVVAILGASDFFRREAVDAVIESLDQAAELRTIDGSETTDGSELDDLRGAALFGAGSWLVVRRAGGWLKAHGERLLTALENRADGCGLVLDVGKLDRRTKVAKTLGSLGELFEFRDLYSEPYDRSRSPLEAELVGWIGKRARDRGMRLSADAAFMIMTTVGQDLAELCAELDRLAPLCTGKNVDVEFLRQHLHTSFESTPFEFAEAFLSKNRRRCERSLSAMFARGVRSRDGSAMDRGGVFPFVTSWLHQSLCSVYEGRVLLQSGVPARDVAGRAGVRAFADRYTAQVQKCSIEWLRHALGELHDCQRRLRTDGEDPERLLARLLAKTLGPEEGAA